jgi:hypothetical protein
MKLIESVEIRLLLHRYYGEFQRKNTRGVWRKFAQIGNATISCDLANILLKLGHTVSIIEIVEEEE